MLHLRPRNRFEDLDGVYLTGGGTHPGSGLPVIFESARITSRLLLEDLGLAMPERRRARPRRSSRSHDARSSARLAAASAAQAAWRAVPVRERLRRLAPTARPDRARWRRARRGRGRGARAPAAPRSSPPK